jgi:chloramphenicol O-acetyltransferase type A
MQVIDQAKWPRRDHFLVYGALEHPYFSLTVDLDVTGLLASLKEAGLPVYPTIIYAVSKAANAIPEFRTRIRGDEVVLHDAAAPSFTVPWKEDLFSFCAVDFEPDRDRFLERCLAEMAKSAAVDSVIQVGAFRDDVLYMTCFPWGAFTGMTHPTRANDSIPRFAWGKITSKEGREVMPFNLQLHHGLADGVHAARFLASLEALLASDEIRRPSGRERAGASR